MNRMQLSLAALLGALMPLVFDSALKGAALLAAAALCALVLYKASAATRHLVWLAAVVALLIVPVLSFALPQWRILPQWTASPLAETAAEPVTAPTVTQMTERTQRTQGTAVLPPPSAAPIPAISAPPLAGPGPQALPTPIPHPASRIPDPVRTWRDWLPLAWAGGFAFLALRLLAAHVMLRRAARSCTALTAPPDGFIAAAFTDACAQLGIRRRVALLLDEKRTIPVVWGVFRPQLLLPAEAREWSEEQLRSVLLHELAHIRRRDTLVQWITQIACALHWFNPLVWLAAWRLHAERERACDDLVLASGVRPSAYAEHLLHIATKLSPARWTTACGLAMARKSSLEGRLLAVLSGGRNRRGVTRILVAAAVILAAAVAIPLAMLRAAGPDQPKTDAPATMPLENKSAQELYKIWQANARADGKIPGGLIGQLGARTEESVRINRDDNPDSPHAKKLEPILPRFDASRDWSPDEAVKLLNDLAALSDIPISNTLEAEGQSRVYPGKPLPEELKDAPWGEPSPEGLRVARPLDPRADSYPIGTALRSRILLHNVGREPVLLRTKSWMQPGYEARDATGSVVNIESTYWTTLGQVQTWRLAPGEYMEILTPGLGVGKGAGKDEWADVRVGSWLDVTEPADITLSPGAVSVAVDDSRGSHIKTGEQLKLEVVRERLDREAPLPASAADRGKIVRRVTKDIFGVDPTADEIAAFVSSKSSDPISALANRLLERAGLAPFVGEVKPGEMTFRTTPADPDAANRPKVAIGAGRYTIGDNARLIIVQGKRTDAEIRFWAADQKSEPPGKPHKFELPDGWGTWAITCRPKSGILYVLTKGAVRKIDYSNPAQVKETPLTRGSAEDMPDEFRDEVKRQLDIHGVSDAQQAEILETAATPAETPAPLPGLSPAFTADSIVKAEANTFRLSGNVRLRTGSVAVDADEMTVVPAGPGEKDAGKYKCIGTLTARGNVRVMFKDEASRVNFVQGGTFDWNASTGAVVVKEQPVLQAGNRLFAGTKPDSCIEFNSGRDELYMSGMDMQVLGWAATVFTADHFPGTSSTRIPDPAKPGTWSGYHGGSVAEGKSRVTVLHPLGEDPVVFVVTGRAARVQQGSEARAGSLTMDVATSDKTITIRYTWPEDNSGFLDLKTGGYPVSRFDLRRGRVFFVHFEKLEFSADVFQVPAGVKVPVFSLSDDEHDNTVAAVTKWYASCDDRARWECSRVVVPEVDYKPGQPLDAAAEKIVWGEVNDVGLRLGLGGLEPGASFPVGQQLPVKQYIRNDSTKAITFSPTQIFNEGVGGELVRVADGKKFPHKKGYPWQGFFHRVRLAPGHYIALGSGPMRTIMAEKDGSSPGGMDMMAHGFTVLPGEYTLQLTHDIGQFQGRPVNFNFGDPRGAPGLGEWTGVLKSAAVPLRLVDEQVKTARAGGSEAFGRYMIAFDKGVLKLRHYNGYPNMALVGGPWEDQSRDWKIPAADGEYVAAWAVGGNGLWVKDASGITHLIVKENLTETGRWTLDQASGGLGGMPAGVRAALQLPPLAASQPFDFKKLPNAPGAAKISGDFFEMALSPGTVLKVPHKGGGFFIESGGSAYGPAEGNPVVELGLTELLRARLSETPNTAGLEMLRHMIADGRGAIRDCAFRLLADLKAPQAPFDYDTVFHAMIHASIEDADGPRELSPEAHRGYTWFHNLFHTTRREWERTRPLLAAGRYQPGEALGADTTIVWTPGPDGMSLGVAGLRADTNLEIGKSTPVVVYLRNDSTAPVKLSVPADHNPVIQISLTDGAGKTHRAIYSFGAPLTGYRHHELAPGTGAKVAAFDLEACATPDEADRAEHKEGKPHNPRLAVPAGTYELHLEYRNYQENPVPKGAASEWTGKVTARPVPMKVAAAAPKQQPAPEAPKSAAQAKPQDEFTQTLFESWMRLARTDGKIPGGIIGRLAESVDVFIKQAPKHESTPKLAALRPKLDASRDWTQAEVVAVLEEIAPINTGPLTVKALAFHQVRRKQVHSGEPLPKELETAAWGQPVETGLRAAWLLEPRAEQYAAGTVLKARVLFHNAGKVPVVFQTDARHCTDGHTARDAKGAEIPLKPAPDEGMMNILTFRLLPGEYCEMEGSRIAVGSTGDAEADRSKGARISIIEVKAGDEITLTHSVEASQGGWAGEPPDPMAEWMEKVTAGRVQLEAPMPRSAADRELLIRRVTLDLTGLPPTPEEIAAFTTDNAPDALEKLSARLQANPVKASWSGWLPTGETKFRVIAADPNAAKAPRTANAPAAAGKHQLPKRPDESYTKTGVHCQKFLEEDAKSPGGELMGDARWGPAVRDGAEEPLVLGLRVASDAKWTIGGQARVQLLVRAGGASDVKFPQTPRSDNGLSVVAIDKDGKEHGAEIAQFDGLLTLNHLLLPRSHVVMVKAFTLRFDPDKRGVSEPGVAAFHLPPGDYTLRCKWDDARPDVAHEGEWTGDLVSVDHKFTLTAPGAPASETPKAGAQIKPATEQKLKWGEPANGLRMALAWPPTLGEPGMGDAPEFFLVVQNVSEAAVRLTANDAAPNPRRLMMRDKGSPLQGLRDPTTMPGDWLLQPREVAFVHLFQQGEKEKGGRITSAAIEDNIRAFPQYSMTAEMSIEKAPAGAWTGKLSTGETRGSVDAIPPKNKFAQGLYKSWTTASRTDGKIPGALIGALANSVKTFINGNPTRATTPRLEKMLPRFDATRDWSGPDTVALLDELAAVHELPIIAAHEHEAAGIILTGIPLSAEREGAPWGETLSNGLRMAWWLEPRAAEHRLGTALKSHILIHNAGKETVVFRTSGHIEPKARDAKGSEIKVESVTRGIRSLLRVFRLAPGESLFIERPVPAIGIGPMENHEDWQNTNVASWIEAKAGDEVTVTGTVPLSDWNETPEVLDGEPRWWLDHITARLSRHYPFPADKAARERLLYRVAMELFGTPVSEEINAAFVADNAPNALESLAMRLFHRPGLHAWAGPLTSTPTKFRVLPVDPDAAKKPRTASNPGEYPLNENATLVVTRRHDGERIVNDAEIRFAQPEPEAVRPPGPFKLKLPDGYNSWAAAWIRGGTVMWVTEKGLLRTIDFSNISKVEETRYEADSKPDAPIPPDIREALRAALDVPDAPKQMQEPLKPGAPPAATETTKTAEPKEGADAKLPNAGGERKLPPVDGAPVHPRLADDRYAKSGVPLEEQTWPMPPWGAEKEGLSTGIRVIGDARIGSEVKVELWVRNSGAKDVKFSQNPRADVGLSVVAKDKDGKEHHADITRFSAFPIFHHLLLPPGYGVKVKEFKVKFGAEKNDKLERGWVNLQLTPGDYKLHAKWSDSHALVTHTEDWTGELTSGEVDVTLVGADAPKTAEANAETPKPKGSDTGRAEEEFKKGQTAFEAKDRKAALRHFLKAVELDPNCAKAHSNLAVLYATEDPAKLDTARYHYKRATALGRPRETQLDKLFGKTAAPAPASAAPKTEKPMQGAKLQPGTEEKLEWGEPVNGLRMALAWPPTLGEPVAGEVPDFFLAVQNVSAAPVRLCTTPEAPNERRLTFSTDGRIQSRFVSSESNGGDATLGPREVLFLRLFMESAKDPENVPHGSMMASAVRQGPGVKLLADMEIAKAPSGAWTGKLATPWTRAGIGVEAPKNRKAHELFKVWLQHTRVNGKVPGGHIARLGDRVKEFLRANTGDKSGDPYAKKMEPLVSRLDGARDWDAAEASALLNDIAAVSDVPLSVMLEETAGGTIQYSLSLKPELENAPWGEALPNGLRVACLLEPRAPEHRLGTPLKMRILVHNAGNEPVVIRTRTWHHIEPTARDAKRAEIKMESVTRYTRPPLVAYRLVPGRFIELASPGLGIGRYGYHDFKDADIASWIGAKEGDEVTLTPGRVPLSDWNEASILDGEPRWWLDFITARLSLANPLPADATERTQLLKSTVRELFQNEATAEEIAAFVADREPNALDSLAKRLAQRPSLTPFSGSLQSGTSKFRVTPADPNGAKPSPKPASSAPAAKP